MSGVDQPRKRRAAAVAAQKNWQILAKDSELDRVNEDDIIWVDQDDKKIKKGINNSSSHSELRPIVIDEESVRKRRKLTTDNTDGDYMPKACENVMPTHSYQHVKHPSTSGINILNKKITLFPKQVPKQGTSIASQIHVSPQSKNIISFNTVQVGTTSTKRSSIGILVSKPQTQASSSKPKSGHYLLVRNEDPFEADTSVIIAKPVDVPIRKSDNVRTSVFRVLPNELILFPDVFNAIEDWIIDLGREEKKKKQVDEIEDEKKDEEEIRKIEITEESVKEDESVIEGVEIEGVEVKEKIDENLDNKDDGVVTVEQHAMIEHINENKHEFEEKMDMDIDREDCIEEVGIDIEEIEKERDSKTGTIIMECEDSDYELPSGECYVDSEENIQIGRGTRRSARKGNNRKQEISTGALDMQCEIMEDEYADDFNFICEDDLVSEKQFSEMKESKKQFDAYVKHVVAAKHAGANVRFFKESECSEPVGESERTSARNIPVQTVPAPGRVTIKPTLGVSMSRPQTAIRMNSPMITRTRLPTSMTNMGGTSMPNILRIGPTQSGFNQIQQGVSNLSSNQLVINSQGQLVSHQGQHMVLTRASNAYNAPYTIIPTSSLRLVVPGGMPTQTLQLMPQGIGSVVPSSSIPSGNQTLIMRPASHAVSSSLIGNQGVRISQSQMGSSGMRFPTQTITRSVIDLEKQQQAKKQAQPNMYNLIKTAVPKDRTPTMGNVVLAKDKTTPMPSQSTGNRKADCLAMIKGGSKKLDSQNHFSIKPLPFSWPSTLEILIQSLVKLDNILMNEKFKESPLKWMINARLLQAPKCKKCQSESVVPTQKKVGSEYRDEWQCSNARCRSTIPVEHPSIFSDPMFKSIAASQLLFVIYYWAIQVDVEDLIKTGQINLNIASIHQVWRKVQNICTKFLQSKTGLIGSSKATTVEVATVLVGNYHVVGAMEAGSNGICKLGVIHNSLALLNNDELYKWIKSSIKPGSVIKTCESKFSCLSQHGFRVFVLDKKAFFDNSETTKLNNVGGYMIQHLQKLFKDIDVNSLTKDVINDLLSELQWREVFGRDPHSAFTNIIKHIADQCRFGNAMRAGPKSFQTKQANQQLLTHSQPATYSSQLQQQTLARRAQSSTPKVTIPGPDIIYTDEYFYASLELKRKEKKTNPVNDAESSLSSIQCHLCQMFFDNILIVKHLLEHLEHQRKNRVRKGDDNDIECKHCLRFFNARSMEIHEELAGLKLVKHSCRICTIPLFTRSNYMSHMKLNHFPNEMPYSCDICTYRSSFQKNLFDHFQKEHQGLNSIQCLFCLKVLNSSGKNNFSQSIYTHLANHYAVATVYNCDKCILSFINKNDLKNHCFKAHNSAKLKYDDKFEVVSFTLAPDERQLSVRAAESELFTPNTQSNLSTNEALISDNQSNEPVVMNFEVTPDISDFLCPEVQIDPSEAQTVAHSIIPLDSDYSNTQLETILTSNFKFSHNSDSLVTENDKIVRCKECKNLIAKDHFSAKSVCNLCNYTTHCKNSYAEHLIKGHAVESTKFIRNSAFTELGSNPTLMNCSLKCGSCHFSTMIGNKMAMHLANMNHSISILSTSSSLQSSQPTEPQAQQQ